MGQRGVFYRGDDRHPVDDDIFEEGFGKQNIHSAQVGPKTSPELRYPRGALNAPDIVTSTAVCVTKDFFAAALFPVDTSILMSWIYLLDLDVSKMYNTQQRQYNYVRDLVKQNTISGPGVADALWPMFGQERAVDEVEPDDIIGAVRIFRGFNGNSVLQGGQFSVFPPGYVANPDYTRSEATSNQAAKAISTFGGIGNWLKMPTQAQGLAPIAT
jgi:hypothetical protein